MKPPRHQTVAAMTLIEVLMVVAVLLFLVALALYLPSLARSRARSSKIACVNNVKQVCLAFKIWAGDNNDLFPMQVSTNDGGTMEFVGDPNSTFRHFLVMSNELSTPMILYCPNETNVTRLRARSFGTTPPPGARDWVSFTGNSNLSYFVGVDAVDVNLGMFLTGDRNITNRVGPFKGLLLLATNEPAGWTRELHVHRGNIGLADGSANMYDALSLPAAMADSGVPTNRLALP